MCLRSIELSVVCSRILTTPELNFVNRLGIKLMSGENKEEKKGKKAAPWPAPTQAQTHTHLACGHCLSLDASGLVDLQFQSFLSLATG